MYKKIKREGGIEVIVNSADLINGSNYQQGGYMLLVQSLPEEFQYTAIMDDIEVNVAKIETIHEQFVDLIFDEAKTGKKGIAINMLNGNQTPYVYVKKSKLKKDVPFIEEKITLEDYSIDVVEDKDNKGNYFVEIGTYNGTGGRGAYTDFNEMLEWFNAYGKVLIINKQIEK